MPSEGSGTVRRCFMNLHSGERWAQSVAGSRPRPADCSFHTIKWASKGPQPSRRARRPAAEPVARLLFSRCAAIGCIPPRFLLRRMRLKYAALCQIRGPNGQQPIPQNSTPSRCRSVDKWHSVLHGTRIDPMMSYIFFPSRPESQSLTSEQSKSRHEGDRRYRSMGCLGYSLLLLFSVAAWAAILWMSLPRR
jgi:hypothetical protein